MDNVHDLEKAPEIFKAILKPSAVQQFKDWSKARENPFHFERLFFRRDKFADPLPDLPCYGGREYGNPVDRLVPILRCVDAVSRGEEIAHMMPQIRAYALMWPAKASKEFQQEVAENKTDALVIMLSFYATTWWLLSERVWWVKHRSKALCEAILKYLGDSMDTEWGRMSS
ncbi:hypothetical protein PT974_05282 [Cladobotryum mycophilum]|uniref:Uncharacterized protein n=1 Tax=Cladobotryum mycophilum TaxID=491253 RepID=A0ABR0SIP5_9HYPO